MQAELHDEESLIRLRLTLIKARQQITSALSEAESEAQRMFHWVRSDRMSHWERELRRRQEEVQQARDKVNQKRLYKGVDGRPQSAVDEEHAFKKARAGFEEAQLRMAATKRWAGLLQREIDNYRGIVQRLSSIAQEDLRAAVAELGLVLRLVEGYSAGPAVREGGPTEAPVVPEGQG